MLAQPPGGIHELWRQVEQVTPSGRVHPVPELGELRHLVPQVCGVVGVELLRQQGEVLLREAHGLAEVLDDALYLVGRDGPGQDGVLGPEVRVDALNQLVPEPPGEVEVDVREHRHILGDEALQGEVPLQGVDVADSDQVPDEQCHRRAAPPPGRPLLHRRLGVYQAALLHDPLREERDLPVEQQEAGQVEMLDQPELLPEALLDLLGHRPVAPRRRLVAEPTQVALGRIAVRHGGVRQGVAEIGAEIEGALLRDTEGVGDGLWPLGEEPCHLVTGLQVEVVVGPQVRQRLVYGGVEPCGDQRVLEARAFRDVVVDVVRGDHRHTGLRREPGQPPVPVSVAVQEVLLELHVHRVPAVPVDVPLQEHAGLAGPSIRRHAREMSSAPAGQQDDSVRVKGKVRGVEPRVPAVGCIGDSEEPRYVRVPLPGAGEQREPGAVVEGQLAAGDGPDVQAVGEPGEFQCAAQVRVGQG